nr:SGNH/GDSL hydrolase family protein [Candidatus Sigynarchaeota archaeon]
MKTTLAVACLGDSLTAGSPGFSGFSGWSGNPESQYEYWLDKIVQEKYPNAEVDFVNFGVGGNVIWQMQYRFKRDVLRLMPSPDYVILFGGINDLLGHGALPADIVADYAELGDLIHASGAKLIAMEIAPCTVTKLYVDRIKEANRGIHGIAMKAKAPIVPLYASLQDTSSMGLNAAYDIGDGVHFNVPGYKKIGETIFTSVMQGILSGGTRT